MKRMTMLAVVFSMAMAAMGCGTPKSAFVPGWESTAELVARHGSPCSVRQPSALEVGLTCGATGILAACDGIASPDEQWWTYKTTAEHVPACKEGVVANQWHYFVADDVPVFVVFDRL
jgi:hypothetical protein